MTLDFATILFLGLVAAAAAIALRFAALLRRKNIDIVVRANRKRHRERYEGPRHVFFCVADHFEPYWHNTDDRVARDRVAVWRERYPAVVDRFRDGGGRAPRHAFFYPQEEYRPELLEPLAELARLGYGDVEVHLHHDRDTPEGLRVKLEAFTGALHGEHGLLRVEPRADRIQYAFIHGNWTLANSAPGGEFCGVDNELTVLRETGCYADFTYPSAPHPTQPPIINRIYYATGDPNGRRAHHSGVDARYGRAARDGLLLFTGPLALNWRRRRRGLFPAVENGDITPLNPVAPDRVDLWVETGVGVREWPRWVFIKAYTHGAQEGNAGLLLGDGSGGLAEMYAYLLERYNDGANYVMHFATPWEMYRCVRVLESADEDAIRAVEEFSYPF